MMQLVYNTGKAVLYDTAIEVVLTTFEVFGNLIKHYLGCLIYFLK